MLGNGNENRLVIGGSVDGCETVGAFGESSGDISSEDAALSRAVKTLEKGEARRVRGVGLTQGRDGLNDDVRVTLDVASRVDLLRSREVVLLSVDEVTSLEVADGHLDCERSVRLDGAEVGRELELRRRHVRGGGDDAHGRGVARAGLDLLPVSDGQLDGSAEVDEVVG